MQFENILKLLKRRTPATNLARNRYPANLKTGYKIPGFFYFMYKILTFLDKKIV